MILTEEFIGDFPEFTIPCYIISKLLGFEITKEHVGIDVPLLEYWAIDDSEMVYDDYIFYFSQDMNIVDKQLVEYLSLKRDQIIDDILK